MATMTINWDAAGCLPQTVEIPDSAMHSPSTAAEHLRSRGIIGGRIIEVSSAKGETVIRSSVATYRLTHTPIKPVTPEQLAALQAYAKRHGRKWKEALSTDWYYARLTGHLHSLRNSHGPTWLQRFTLPKGGQ